MIRDVRNVALHDDKVRAGFLDSLQQRGVEVRRRIMAGHCERVGFQPMRFGLRVRECRELLRKLFGRMGD